MKRNNTIENELERLRKCLSEQKSVDSIDVAVIETLASDEVQQILIPILDEGAVLNGVTMDAAGALSGIMLLTFNTSWIPGSSHLTLPNCVKALVEIEPPKVLKVQKCDQNDVFNASAFIHPTGLLPIALSKINFPRASEVLDFNIQANDSFMAWAQKENFTKMMRPPATMLPSGSGDLGGGGGGGIQGLTTGTTCSSFLCIERSSEDWDTIR